MAYTGTGTQDDPYIVDNWEDLKTLASTIRVWIALQEDAENKVMDIAQTEDGKGIHQGMNFRANIIGNGWTIRNLYLAGGTLFNGGTIAAAISNLRFENIICNSTSVFYGSYSFQNCQFTGLMQNQNTFFTAIANSSVSDCAFHLHFAPSCKSGVMIEKATVSRCTMHLHGVWNGGSVYNANCTTQDNYMTGELELRGGDLCVSSNQDGNTVIALTVTGTGTYTANTAGSAANIVDGSLVGEEIVKQITGTNWYCLTTEQMQSVEYLTETIGFPVVAEET